MAVLSARSHALVRKVLNELERREAVVFDRLNPHRILAHKTKRSTPNIWILSYQDPQRARCVGRHRADTGITVIVRIPCAPWIRMPSMSAVADGPVMNTAYFASTNPWC